MKISLCMIVKNEEKNIVNCLDRALKVVDEAVIVDTGSTDKTKDLLIENYGRNPKVKIIEYKWESDFSKARNKSLEYATGDWILVLDADERIFCNRDRLEDFLESREDKAYIIPIYNVIERHNITITSTMIRLFKNDNPIYKGAIHEQILVDGKAFMADKIEGDICKIYHYGYTETVFKEKGKQDRNMDIIKAQIEEEPNSPFHWYNKGVMEMCQKNYDTAIDDFIKSHELTKKKRMAFHNDLVIRLLQCMLMEKKYKTAIKFVKTVANDPIIGQIPDIYYYWGIAHANIKNYPLAVKNFRKAIEKGEYEKGTSKYGAGSFLPKIEWANVLLMEKKKEEAIEKYKEAVLDENNVNRQGLEELKYLLKEENKIEELNQLEKDLSNPKNEGNSLNINKLNNADFDKYKSEVKENIKILVENGMLKEAKEAIKEYEKMIEDDIDIYSIKGVISMMEGDMDGAERILIEGLAIDETNFDLLYNLAYLYETQGKYIESYKFYDKLLKHCDAETKEEIVEKVRFLEKKEEIIRYKEEERNLPKPPVITIITLVYNSKEYIHECAESVLNQSFNDFEWVVLDNGCTDGTSEILKRYAEKDNRIKLFNNELNSIIYNKAINKKFIDYLNNVKTQYTCSLDSDDFLHEDFLKELYNLAKKHNADIAIAGTEMFQDGNTKMRGQRLPPNFQTKDITELGDRFLEFYGSFRPIWGKLIRTSIYIKTRKCMKGNNIKIVNGKDTYICLNILKNSNSIVSINKVLHYYRIRKDSYYYSQVNKNRHFGYLTIYEESKKLLNSWNKLNDENLDFITHVLYSSMKDCIDIASKTANAPLNDRIGVITTILLDIRIRKILNDKGVFVNLVDDGINAINKIVEENSKIIIDNYKHKDVN